MTKVDEGLKLFSYLSCCIDFGIEFDARYTQRDMLVTSDGNERLKRSCPAVR